MKIKEQTRKLATGGSKHSFEVADKADLVLRDFQRLLRHGTRLQAIHLVIGSSQSQ